jgi:hypothetical protein
MSSSESSLTSDTEQQNAIARRYVRLIGTLPSTFSVSIKELMEDQKNGLTELSTRSEFQVTRVMRGPTTLAVLYWCSKTFRSSKINSSQRLS